MYRRYSQTGDGNMPLSQINRNRIKNIIILVLLAALAALLVISLPLLNLRDNARTLYIQQMQKECQDAYNDALSLSRTTGADSGAILSRVRSNIHSMRVINSLNNAQGNTGLIDNDRLYAVQTQVDQYLQYLTSGMDTGQYTTNLQNTLGELLEVVSNLN